MKASQEQRNQPLSSAEELYLMYNNSDIIKKSQKFKWVMHILEMDDAQLLT
jgi:hypothetical protein